MIRESSEPVPEPLCRRYLERIAGSVTFSRAEQLRNLLRWLGERSLDPHRIPPAEKEVAEAVLNRKDFDPQADSLVRKEMSRLREKLAKYYLIEGAQDEVRVAAGGGYLLAFEQCHGAPPGTAPSCWLVLPFRTQPEIPDDGEQFLEELLIALGARGGPELVASTTALAYRGRTGDVRHFAAECRADFVVEGSLRRKDGLIEAIAWLIDGRTGRARRCGRVAGPATSDLAHRTATWLLQEGIHEDTPD